MMPPLTTARSAVWALVSAICFRRGPVPEEALLAAAVRRSRLSFRRIVSTRRPCLPSRRDLSDRGTVCFRTHRLCAGSGPML